MRPMALKAIEDHFNARLVPTLTCVAIGPHAKIKIDPITGGLDLF